MLDAIVIETTGLADPAPVAQTFFVNAAVERFARLDGIITLVDAKHIEQHLDEEKPEGAENEAVEQVAFADRILLNKTDLVPSGTALDRVEARLRGINMLAPIVRTVRSTVTVDSVLNIRGFDLKRTLDMDPEFLDTDGDHAHDASVTSLSVVHDGAVDLEAVKDWVHALLQTQGALIYRMKGVLAVAGRREPLVFQAVHMIFKWTTAAPRSDSDRADCRLVFIGKDLDHAALKAGFASCLPGPELWARRAASEAHAARVAAWAEARLPRDFAGEAVSVAEARRASAECPIETVLTVALPKPKDFVVKKPLIAVDEADVAALMRGWATVVDRGRRVRDWATDALPKAVAGSRVLVDETRVPHVTADLQVETLIHVLATPPWSMRVLRKLEDVTRKDVSDILALTALCGACGIPTLR